jgi:hypothetical protein
MDPIVKSDQFGMEEAVSEPDQGGWEEGLTDEKEQIVC